MDREKGMGDAEDAEHVDLVILIGRRRWDACNFLISQFFLEAGFWE